MVMPAARLSYGVVMINRKVPADASRVPANVAPAFLIRQQRIILFLGHAVALLQVILTGRYFLVTGSL